MSYPGSDKVIETRHTEPHTHGDGVEQEEDKVLVVGVAHAVVDPANGRGHIFSSCLRAASTHSTQGTSLQTLLLYPSTKSLGIHIFSSCFKYQLAHTALFTLRALLVINP